jgi:hypothetical protein
MKNEKQIPIIRYGQRRISSLFHFLRELNLNNYFESTSMLYFSIAVMFVLVFIGNFGDIHIESFELHFVRGILHPEHPLGEVVYNPHLHYDYIVAFVAKIVGCEADSPGLARIFWFFEQAFTLIVLVKISNFLFKGDKLTLVLMVFMYLMLKSGETDQKTMLRPLYFLAIYYFLKEKWMLAAIFSASISYLHIGVAIWWFVPSCFVLGIMYLLKRKQIGLKEIVFYSCTVALLSSPILYFYIGEAAVQDTTAGDFAVRYFYWVNNSVLLLLTNQHMELIISLITVAVFVVGYNRWKQSGGGNDYIVPLVFGVLVLYVLDFVLVDLMFNGTAIKLQLLRSFLNVQFFASLLFAFLIARQVRNGNYIFLILLLLLFIPNPFWLIYSFFDRYNVIYVFYAIVVVYVMFEQSIGNVTGKIVTSFYDKMGVLQPAKYVDSFHRFFRQPVTLAGFIILLLVFQQILTSSPIKSYAKSVLGIQQHTVLHQGMSKGESLYRDIATFTNEKISGENVILVVPFHEADFEYYTHQRVFITSSTLYPGGKFSKPTFSSNFQHIFENDLEYSIEELRAGGSWEDIWQSVDEKLIRKWKRDYEVTHVIREKDMPLSFPILYQNSFYTVYEIK